MIESASEKQDAKKQKVAEAEVDAAADAPLPVVKEEKVKLGQQSIQSCLKTATGIACDEAIAEFFYGCNISPSVAGHPLFKGLVATLKTAPASYKPPDQNRLGGDLLDSTVARLKAEEAPVRAVTLKDGGTVASDGWDDVAKNHLINFLVGTSKGFFFDGTIMLKSDDSENADRVAELICAEIEAVGKHSIVQVVTDTCSVMKAAWKIIEKKF
eukprot:3445494-Prymnesium_polylepis.1